MGMYMTLHTAYGIQMEDLFSGEDEFLKPEVCEALGVVPGSDEASLEYWVTEGCPSKDFESAFCGDLDWEVGIDSQLLVVPNSLKNNYSCLNLLSKITTDKDFDREAMDKLAEIAGVRAEYFAFVSRG